MGASKQPTKNKRKYFSIFLAYVGDWIQDLSVLKSSALPSEPSHLTCKLLYFSSVYMVTEEEWTNFCKFFSIDCQISVTRNRIQRTASNGGSQLTTADDDDANLLSSSPPICKECIAKKLQQELDDRLVRITLHTLIVWNLNYSQHLKSELVRILDDRLWFSLKSFGFRTFEWLT